MKRILLTLLAAVAAFVLRRLTPSPPGVNATYTTGAEVPVAPTVSLPTGKTVSLTLNFAPAKGPS